MDRSDEFDPKLRDEASTKDSGRRAGDIFGLDDAVVPKSPEDPTAESDPESAAKRRERIRIGDEERAFNRTSERSSGGKSIDTGTGGSGTQVREE
jgi:hypothetical protein